MKCYSFLPLVLALAVFGGTAHAAPSLIYDNGAPNLQDGFEITHLKEANSFTLSAGAILGNIKFWDIEFSSDFQSSVYWEIRSNAANNLPGSILFSGTSSNLTHNPTGNKFDNHYPEYVITFDIGSVSLPAGTYWLVLHNGPLSYNTNTDVVWETATSSRTDPSYGDEAPFTNNWESNEANGSSQMAFQLTGVPQSSVPVITAFGININGDPQISFTTISGQHYRVDYKNNMNDASWSTVSGASSVLGTGNVVHVSDTDPNLPNRRFYRVVLL